MQLRNKYFTIKSILNQKLFKKNSPLIISWTLSNKCNRKCIYCDVPNIKSSELTTDEILKVIDELKESGTQRIGFTGGEPLLKKDIGKIVNYCKKKGIFVGIVSNGSLVKEKIKQIKNLNLLQLSLDGTEKTNDKQRYIGSYKDVIQAISTAKKYNLMIWITYVITKNNTNKKNYMHILKLAKQFNLKVFFQPIVTYKNCGKNTEELLPKTNEFQTMIKDLIKKKTRNKAIGNSSDGLKQLYSWPNLINQESKCYAGKLMAHIYPDGKMHPCFNLIYHETKNVKQGIKNAFSSIDKNSVNKCDGCWTYATIEFNLLLSLNTDSIINTLDLLK
jgi:MoaA/NifB/PqqE/SkfB family radical SAM enzyme